MSDETTLLSCPFCGGEAQVLKDGLPYVVIECKRCFCRTNCNVTEAEAIATWNTRAELGSGTCRIMASATDGLCSDNPRKWFKLSCGHSFTLDGLGAPVVCAMCGKAVER